MAMKRRWRKPILLTLLFLLAGAVANVAVAWGIAWCCWTKGGEGLVVYARDEQAPEIGGSVKWPISVPVADAEPWPLHPDSISRLRVWLCGAVIHQRLDAVASRPFEGSGGTAFPSPHYLTTVEASGWPRRSLETRSLDKWSERLLQWEQNVSLWELDWPQWVYAGIDKGIWRVNSPTEPMVKLPIRPRPKEFAANSVFFGSLLAGLGLGPFALRRWVRCKRGACVACVACGYSLRGSASGVCPECGTTFAPSPASRGLAGE